MNTTTLELALDQALDWDSLPDVTHLLEDED